MPKMPPASPPRATQVTLDAALESVDDRHASRTLLPFQAREAFYSYLREQQSGIEVLVAFHLGFEYSGALSNVRDWGNGCVDIIMFCIPVYVDDDGWVGSPSSSSSKRVLIRIPLAYKLGEAGNPGNVEEKLRCEAATFIWIQEQCPEVPIPHLWGFGFPGGQCVCTWPIQQDFNFFRLQFGIYTNFVMSSLYSSRRPRKFRTTPGFCGIFGAMDSLSSATQYHVATSAVDMQTL